MSAPEPTTIGLSEKTHARLDRLREDGHFLEMADAYRCGIALALAYGIVPGEVPTPRKTVFNIGTLDPDKEIASTIRALVDVGDVAVYRIAERLAEWGVEELAKRAERGEIDFGALLEEAEQHTLAAQKNVTA